MSTFAFDNATLLEKGSRRYSKCGIGGAGNFKDLSIDLSMMQNSSSRPQTIPKQTTGFYTTGIGGAGNCHGLEGRARYAGEQPALQDNTRRPSLATRWSYGIGGAGNRAYSVDLSSSSSSTSSCTTRARDTALRSGADNLKDAIIGF